ncbi:MAG: hypothetical protein MUF68_00110 [Cyclobacteriaceae bacterium]|nr:hypothetical protein [Cyclobacteriaceae bacterium]
MKKILSFLAPFILVSCEETNAPKTYDFRHFHNELLVLSKKVEELKTKSKANATEFQISEEEAQSLIQPLVVQSKQLIESYGIETNSELEQTSDEDLVVSALSIYRAEVLLANGYTLEQIENDLNNQTNLRKQDVIDCLGDVLIVGAVISGLQQGAKKLSKELAIKAIKKVAARFLGPIGAMIAVFEFSDCMGWL